MILDWTWPEKRDGRVCVYCGNAFGHFGWCRTLNTFMAEVWCFAERNMLLGIDRRFLDSQRVVMDPSESRNHEATGI